MTSMVNMTIELMVIINILLYICFLISLASSNHCGGDGGSITLASTGMCYLVRDTRSTWNDTNTYCQDHHMKMASMETEEEMVGYLEMVDLLGNIKTILIKN